MFLLNTKFGKIFATNCLDYFTKTKALQKLKKEERTSLLLSKKKQQGLLEEEKLSPADVKCNLDYVAKVIHLSYGYKVDKDGEICTMESQKVIYIDETSKVFSVHRSESKVSIKEINEEDVKIKRI